MSQDIHQKCPKDHIKLLEYLFKALIAIPYNYMVGDCLFSFALYTQPVIVREMSYYRNFNTCSLKNKVL